MKCMSPKFVLLPLRRILLSYWAGTLLVAAWGYCALCKVQRLAYSSFDPTLVDSLNHLDHRIYMASHYDQSSFISVFYMCFLLWKTLISVC